MAYTKAHAIEVGAAMAAATGIPAPIATVWAGSESGTRNNPYGLTDGLYHLNTYPTWQAGVAAAARWLLTGPYYSGVRAAIATRDPYTIMHAIQASPWGPSGYYFRSWPGVAALYGITLPTAPAAHPVPKPTPAPTTGGSPTMSDGARLAAAIKDDAAYSVNVAKGGGDPSPYLAKLGVYADRLAATVDAAPTPAAPAPAPAAPAPTPAVPTPAVLSSDPDTALAQILAAVGFPIPVNPDGSTGSLDPSAVVAACNPTQNAQLALLGFWGPPPGNGGPTVDYSLFLRYYQQLASGNWEPKPDYASTGTWQAYMAGR